MDRGSLAAVIDHTNLYPDPSIAEIRELCGEANEHGFHSVCVYSGDVATAREAADDTVRVCAVAGFPHGKTLSRVKAEEAHQAVDAGADEIDMVINQTYVKSGRIKEAVEDIRAVREAAPDVTLKVICETCNLSEDELVQACRAAVRADADFVKTSTGFGEYGARAEDIRVMRDALEEVNVSLGIKASGG
ncbi:MAG: deoxyribose-phosphate aldolase, partial [Candidatus Nanohaloarchaea archaeon]|nr:deoxyribose-phosphate aldolase [Candidatus Nanohaloarchaea archaeon]